MRRVAEQLKAAGDTIEDALTQLADHSDLALQLSALRTELRTDQRIANDRYETLNAKLDHILALLGATEANGHG